jgi:hypothetical protein
MRLRLHYRIPLLAAFTLCLSLHVTAQDYNSVCTLPDGALVMVGHQNEVPAWTLHTDAWALQPNPAGTPGAGRFTTVATDAAGNLYVAYEDRANPKKKLEGLLVRASGTWTALPKLPKGWSGVYDVVASSPDKFWFRSWHDEERRTVLVHWNGSAYSELPLPAGAKELHTLFLDSDGALLTEGDMGDAEGVYRYTNGAWQAMGQALDVLRITRFVRLSDGTLVCSAYKYSDETRALFGWDGLRWAPLPGADVVGKRDVEDLCPGPDGRLYLLIEADDEEGDPQRLACWQNGTLRWYKGSEANALLRNDLYQLACDRSGLLHARDYSKELTFPWADFEWGTDGYPATDARAAEVWELYKQQLKTYTEKASAVNDAYRVLVKERSELNGLAVGTRYNEWYAWMSKETAVLVDLTPKGANRLVDRYREQLVSANLMYAAIREHASVAGRGGEFEWEQTLLDRVLAATEVNKRTAQALDAEQLAYPVRNGLTPLPVIVKEVRDPYPAKDVKAAEVLAVIKGNVSAYNQHVGFCRTALISVDKLSGAAAFELEKYVHDNLHPWVASVNLQLDALGVPPEQNRLQDAFRPFLTTISHMGSGLQAYADLRSGNSTAEDWRQQAERLESLQGQVTAAMDVLNKVYGQYLVRNGL